MRRLVSAALAAALVISVSGSVLAAQQGTITVSYAQTVGASSTLPVGSVFTATGCGFKANSTDYAMVVYGPAAQTSSYGYWVDYFAVDASGCGSSTVSWSSSGVAGTFQVWVARSPSGNFTTAQPASNVVPVTITTP